MVKEIFSFIGFVAILAQASVMMNRTAILLLAIVSFAVFGGVSRANETGDTFESRLSQYNAELKALDPQKLKAIDPISKKNIECTARATALWILFRAEYEAKNTVCEPDSNGTPQIILRQ